MKVLRTKFVATNVMHISCCVKFLHTTCWCQDHAEEVTKVVVYHFGKVPPYGILSQRYDLFLSSLHAGTNCPPDLQNCLDYSIDRPFLWLNSVLPGDWHFLLDCSQLSIHSFLSFCLSVFLFAQNIVSGHHEAANPCPSLQPGVRYYNMQGDR
jgi:hypothetical protein